MEEMARRAMSRAMPLLGVVVAAAATAALAARRWVSPLLLLVVGARARGAVVAVVLSATGRRRFSPKTIGLGIIPHLVRPALPVRKVG